MNREIGAIVPPSIQKAYEISDQDSVNRLSGGLVNETLLVDQGERMFVLRKLAPILGESTVRNTCIISDHLSSLGWEAPTIHHSVTGDTHTYDEQGQLWHGLTHIKSDADPSVRHDDTLALQAGQLIGSWHHSVKSLDFEPDSLPHFHDTAYIAHKLEADSSLLPNASARDLARAFLLDFAQQPSTYPGDQQIIHGDPKLNNMLYRNGEPFTLIDFDCVMRESVWTDTGDFLRSMSGKLVDTGQEITEVVESFIKGYLAGNESALSNDEGIHHALQATRRIACELGMRYLSDIVDGQDYFSWDQTAFSSRHEALYDRAFLQFRVLQTVNKYLSEE